MGTEVCYPQVTNNKYVTNIYIYYYYIYSVTPYISYEDPASLTTTTTDNITSIVADPYHISHHEVCTVIT